MEPCLVPILHSGDYLNFWILLHTIQGVSVSHYLRKILGFWSLHNQFMNVIITWLVKNIVKYHLWLWSSLVKILELSLLAFGHSG